MRTGATTKPWSISAHGLGLFGGEPPDQVVVGMNLPYRGTLSVQVMAERLLNAKRDWMAGGGDTRRETLAESTGTDWRVSRNGRY